MAYDMGDNMEGDYLDGPIIQPIPDNLMIGDFIEINGCCRGPEVIVELLTDANEAASNTGVLPLRIILNAGGPVQVMSQNRAKVQKQEHFVKNGIQDNLAFELCIYALEEGYDIKLNNQRVCHVPHLVKLEEVGAISMDGDADFTSIEFKDVFGEEDDVNYPQEEIQPGFMRVQESRQSSMRKKAAPLLVRSSTRRSQRSNRIKSPPVLAKSQWETSADLTRPELDIDRPGISMSNTYSNEITQPTVNVPTYSLPNRDTMNLEAQRLADKNKKKHGSWLIGKGKKNGSETDLQGSYVDLEKKKKGSIRDLFRRKKSTPTTSNADVRQSKSMPSVVQPIATNRISTDLNQHYSELGGGIDRNFVRGPVPSTLLKQPAANIAAYVAAQKAVPEFEDFSLTTQKGIITDPGYSNSRSAPSVSAAPRESTYANLDTDKDRKLKGTAPELADVLLDQGRAQFDHETTLTGQIGEPVGTVTSSRISAVPGTVYAEKPVGSSAGQLKLKGPAPEMAAVIEDRHGPVIGHDTQLTSNVTMAPVATAPVVSGEYVNANQNFKGTAPVVSGEYVNTTQKIKGTAPEMASQLHDIYGSRGVVDDNYTLSGMSQAPKPRDTVYTKPTTDLVNQKPVGEVIYQKPPIDVDYEKSRNVQTHPTYESPVQPRPVLVTEKSQPQRPMSAGRPHLDDDLSDVSTVHSDQEFYLEVGRSAYYLERKKSLKRHRSRRTAQKERDARRSMGLEDRDSQRSSISSLKPGDPVLIARKRMGTDRAGVNSWLNGHASTYGHERSTERPRVYAAPPVLTESHTIPNLVIDAYQMKKDDYKAELPLPLRPGRSATLIGHFVHTKDVPESCSILLTGPTGEESTLILELWSNARLDVYGFVNHKPVMLLRCDNVKSDIESEFVLELHNRDAKLAVSLHPLT
ncbi:unnamed protein product [Echinostoma caproni]|uniref:Galectin domain-containing protein n=1 Tax=Echinostoma caproni TaxID=27848 RepID=A0A183ADY7_9TREM|nr:unnamed protein product [Echinostoma caproni]